MTALDVNADDFAPSEAIMRAQQACRDADKVAYEKGYAAGYRAAHADLSGEVREITEALRSNAADCERNNLPMLALHLRNCAERLAKHAHQEKP